MSATVREIAKTWIENADTTVGIISIEQAAEYVGWMDAEDLPEDMTPETFADAWNSLLEEELK